MSPVSVKYGSRACTPQTEILEVNDPETDVRNVTFLVSSSQETIVKLVKAGMGSHRSRKPCTVKVGGISFNLKKMRCRGDLASIWGSLSGRFSSISCERFSKYHGCSEVVAERLLLRILKSSRLVTSIERLKFNSPMKSRTR